MASELKLSDESMDGIWYVSNCYKIIGWFLWARNKCNWASEIKLYHWKPNLVIGDTVNVTLFKSFVIENISILKLTEEYTHWNKIATNIKHWTRLR
jgi:hypothetical protein